MKIFKKILSIIIPVLIFCSVLYGLIFAFNKKESLVKEDLKTTYVSLDPGSPELMPGYQEWAQFAPLSRTHSVKTLGSKVIYDAVYNVDAKTLRVVPGPESKEKEHVIFSGCSMTFGIGVNDSETFPAYFKKMNPEVDVVNLAFGGGGPNLVLRALDFIRIEDLTHQKKGHMIYVFIADHLNRWFARPAYMEWAPPMYAHYEVDKGKVKYMGIIGDQKFYQDFQVLKKMQVQKSYIKADASVHGLNKWTDEQVGEFMTAILSLKEKYLAAYPAGKFYFYYHPTHGTAPELSAQLRTQAKRFNIDVINSDADFHNYMATHNLPAGSLNIEHDGHGKPRLHEFMAAWFGNYLKND